MKVIAFILVTLSMYSFASSNPRLEVKNLLKADLTLNEFSEDLDQKLDDLNPYRASYYSCFYRAITLLSEDHGTARADCSFNTIPDYEGQLSFQINFTLIDSETLVLDKLHSLEFVSPEFTFIDGQKRVINELFSKYALSL